MPSLAIRKVDAPKGPILDRIHTCLADKLVGIANRYTRGSKSLVYSSLLRTQEGIVPVVIKFWDLNESPVGAVALNVHNAHVTLNKLSASGRITTLIVPKIYASFLELEDGTLIEFPVDRYIVSRTIEERENPDGKIIQTAGFGINNQLIIADDLSRLDNPRWEQSRKNADRYRIIDRNDRRRNWPRLDSRTEEGLRRDIQTIRRHIPTGDMASKDADIISSLAAIDKHPDEPRYSLATIDFDKLGKVICGGVEIVSMDQFLS